MAQLAQLVSHPHGHRSHRLGVGGRRRVEVVGELLRAHVAETGALSTARWGLAPRAIHEAEVEQRPIGLGLGLEVGLGLGLGLA